MKVIATTLNHQRLIIDGVDAFTANLSATVLNDIETRNWLSFNKLNRASFYQPVDDEYELKSVSGVPA